VSTPQLRLNPADPKFADAVFADIHKIRASEAGRAVFRRLLEAGASVTIDKPLPPTDPPNAWTRLVDPARGGGDTMIAYDPADWPERPGPERPALAALPSDVVLFGRLLDAVALATGSAIAQSSDARSSDAGIPAEMEAYLRERTGARASPAGSGP
jgi:hypothetical protein